MDVTNYHLELPGDVVFLEEWAEEDCHVCPYRAVVRINGVARCREHAESVDWIEYARPRTAQTLVDPEDGGLDLDFAMMDYL